MAERRNGTFLSTKRKHGSEQRGVLGAPRGPQIYDFLKQSQADKARLRELAKRSRRTEVVAPEKEGFGNKNLPSYKHKQEIIKYVDMYKATILGGPTGSGKSTQVPQFLLEAGYDKIFMMVPRRIIADGLYDRLIEELTPHLGAEAAENTVGIRHGERSVGSEDSRIIVMTPNTFNRMEADIRAQYANDKVAIISDEIHEANLYTEIATGVAAKAVHELDNWRLVAASATHNSASLTASFQTLNGGFVPQISIEGRPFDIDVRSSPDMSVMEVYAEEGEQHDKTMIFTSGKNEIDHIIEATIVILESQEKGSSANVVFRKLHGELNDIELGHINDPVQEGQRVVIVSSPAGMSGITIPGVTCVITDGTINRSELDDDKVPGLRRHYLSKAEITQQMGRAGRDVTGGVGFLARPTAVAEDRMRARGQTVDIEQMPFVPIHERDEFGPAEIYNSNLSQVVLSVADLDRQFVDINPFIPNQVNPSDIISAEESLSRLGALNEDDLITDRGRRMNKFPIRPDLSRGMVEAIDQNRSLQQLARTAFTVAALESGGLQDFTVKDSFRWKKLLRPDTSDDVIAQIDLALTPMPSGELEYIKFLEDHDLSYKRVERMRKVTRKIMRECGVRLEHIVVRPPNIVEEEELRRDITAGMIDLVYKKSSILNRRQHYQNIHGDNEATQRFVSTRSIVSDHENELVVGFPRWYVTKRKDGTQVKNNVIEQLMPADVAAISQYAHDNGLLQKRQVEPILESGRVVERFQPMFGSLEVGDVETGVAHETIPLASQEILVQHVLAAPGQAQLALREIADEIEYYQSRLPDGELDGYFNPEAPQLLTKERIVDLVRLAAASTRNAYEIDQGLAQYIFHENISIYKFFNKEARSELRQRTPGELTVEGELIQLHYEDGQPYIIGSKAAIRNKVKGKQLTLSDGREVMVQVNLPGPGKTRIRATDL